MSISNQQLSLLDPQYSFDDFWNAYNKKQGRKETEAFWNKMKPQDRIDAVEKMDNHKAGKEPKFWKDPIRYLRDRRWEDEPQKVEERVFGNVTRSALQKTFDELKALDDAAANTKRIENT